MCSDYPSVPKAKILPTTQRNVQPCAQGTRIFSYSASPWTNDFGHPASYAQHSHMTCVPTAI